MFILSNVNQESLFQDGNITEYAFETMCDKVLALPMKLGLVKKDEAGCPIRFLYFPTAGN